MSIPQKKAQCFQPRDCHSQVLCLKSRIYLNLKLKFNLKIILLLVSAVVHTSIMYYHHELSTTGSHLPCS